MSKPRRSTGCQDQGPEMEDERFLYLLGRNERRARLASPIRPTGLYDTLGDIARGIALTELSPGESKKGLASGGII